MKIVAKQEGREGFKLLFYFIGRDGELHLSHEHIISKSEFEAYIRPNANKAVEIQIGGR